MVKPKDMISPYPKKEPKVAISDRVWYVPTLADLDAFTFPGWHSQELFAQKGPIEIEYCSGNGSWITEKARTHSDICYLAVEKRFDRARKIWSKIKNHSLDNLVVAYAEGKTLSTRYLPSDSVDTIYVNFPDPWPKNRHAKHRIISHEFLREVTRLLKQNGLFILVTDDPDYSTYSLEIFTDHPSLKNVCGEKGYTMPPEDYGTSFFDTLFREQGKTIYYHALQKRAFTDN